MSESQQSPVESPESTEIVEAVAEAPIEATEAVEPEPVEVSEEVVEPEQEAKTDLVTDAMRKNEELKAQLEELKNSNANVFEENEVLKVELEQQEKLVEIAKENAEMKGQLEAIKRNSIVEQLIASGSINEKLRAWSDRMSFDDLQEFAEHAPKIKTILQETNNGVIADEDMKSWHEKESKSRIIT